MSRRGSFTRLEFETQLDKGCCDKPAAVQIGTRDADAAAAGAEQLVAACHQARQFTDIANFTLRCGVCQIGLKGEKEAVEHAKATGHQNFAEY